MATVCVHPSKPLTLCNTLAHTRARTHTQPSIGISGECERQAIVYLSASGRACENELIDKHAHERASERARARAVDVKPRLCEGAHTIRIVLHDNKHFEKAPPPRLWALESFHSTPLLLSPSQSKQTHTHTRKFLSDQR